MPTSNVIGFMENAGRSMTIEEGFAFIERSRRQLDRHIDSDPSLKGKRIVPAFESELRQELNELEADLRKTVTPV